MLQVQLLQPHLVCQRKAEDYLPQLHLLYRITYESYPYLFPRHSLNSTPHCSHFSPHISHSALSLYPIQSLLNALPRRRTTSYHNLPTFSHPRGRLHLIRRRTLPSYHGYSPQCSPYLYHHYPQSTSTPCLPERIPPWPSHHRRPPLSPNEMFPSPIHHISCSFELTDFIACCL